MSELRWILLAGGLLLIVGVYAWGMHRGRRASGRKAATGGSATATADVPASRAAARIEPEVRIDEEIEDPTIPLPTLDLDAVEALGDEAVPVVRREPRIEAEAPAEPPQKIVALRITAMPATPFEGARIHEAIAAVDLRFGRHRIFHRLDASGRSVFSLASLEEPGTLDPATMEGTTFRGLAMFAVLPGPWPAARMLDDLLATARALATRLGGQLQDERGRPLTVQRSGELREEAAGFERGQIRTAVR